VRRRALDTALRQGSMLDPLREGSETRVGEWLAQGSADIEASVVEIHLRSSDPDDLTLREARLLGAADLIAFEEGVAPAILARARADARRVGLVAGERIPEATGLIVVLRVS
jgi:uroporphyrin-III C-methyltransferase/precorrin-2 dehydrogenase/sirohydrochlorin ferrochelatase